MITEKNIDLFEEIKKEDCVIFHCISSDKVMGAGIAKPLQSTFAIRKSWPQRLPERLQGWNNFGYTVFTNGKDKVQLVGNLITKEHYYDKPTYATLTDALNSAFYTLNDLSLVGLNLPKKIVMPKIGCGLDKLEWETVKSIIENIFIDYDIVVCYL